MNRRGFFGALGAALSLPVLANGAGPPKPQAVESTTDWEFDSWSGWSCTVPDGELIVKLEQVGDRMYVFTDRSCYVVQSLPESANY